MSDPTLAGLSDQLTGQGSSQHSPDKPDADGDYERKRRPNEANTDAQVPLVRETDVQYAAEEDETRSSFQRSSAGHLVRKMILVGSHFRLSGQGKFADKHPRRWMRFDL